MQLNRMLGEGGESTSGAVHQDEAVTRLSHKKMLRRVRSDIRALNEFALRNSDCRFWH